MYKKINLVLKKLSFCHGLFQSNVLHQMLLHYLCSTCVNRSKTEDMPVMLRDMLQPNYVCKAAVTHKLLCNLL